MKEEIKEQKKVRMFASFQNVKHQQMILDEVLKEIPKHSQHKLYLYLGMMDSTIAEGYQEENK
tara:strand:+ start:153 stop:341 length:189 start_codon:yes stop_codon:yes gene_type:complete